MIIKKKLKIVSSFFSTNYLISICYYIRGDDMKRLFLFMAVAIVLGTFTGKFLFSKVKSDSTVFSEREDIYFLQEGVYSSEESLNSNTKNISPKLVVKEDNKYYVYVGISKNLEVIKKIKNIYDKKGYPTYQKLVKVGNTEFLSNVEQYDLLSKGANKDNDLLTIQDVVLSNYEELVKG